MAKDTQEAKEVEVERKGRVQQKPAQVGASAVGPVGIVLTTVFLILFSVLLLYGLVSFWPPAVPPGARVPASLPATFLFWTFPISNEARLLLIVALAGALGALVHTLRSFYWYVGNRELVRSWLVQYILLPFVGTALGLIFYLVIRGGFFSFEATTQETSPFGFAALSGLVGMFSEQAVLKLKQLAETLLAKPQAGANSRPQN